MRVKRAHLAWGSIMAEAQKEKFLRIFWNVTDVNFPYYDRDTFE